MSVTPTAALLLTWADADDRVAALRAAPHHLRTYNRGAWEQAERHRFWQPETTPRGIDDRRPTTPISTEIFRRYDARRSARLDSALVWYTDRVRDQQAGVEDRAVVIAWMEYAQGGAQVVTVRNVGEHADMFADYVL